MDRIKLPEAWPTEEMTRAADPWLRMWQYTNPEIKAASLRRLLEAVFEAAPPAQEAEPFAYHVSGWRGKRSQVLIPCETLKGAQEYAAKLKDSIITPLYTHAPSDKLRQAAKKYLNACDHGSAKERETYRALLRAELEKKS